MDINQFLNNFVSQFEDSDTIEVDTSTRFRELPTWDSMTAMCVQTMIHDDYEVTIPDQQFKSLSTVQEVFDFVVNAKKQ
jgi:acyl carrier protein